VAVDHNQQVAGVITRKAETPYSHGFIASIVAYIESTNRCQSFAERAVAIFTDILTRDHSDASGRFLKGLLMKGGTHHLNLHQVLEA
jgi:hypothetical protein